MTFEGVFGEGVKSTLCSKIDPTFWRISSSFLLKVKTPQKIHKIKWICQNIWQQFGTNTKSFGWNNVYTGTLQKNEQIVGWKNVYTGTLQKEQKLNKDKNKFFKIKKNHTQKFQQWEKCWLKECVHWYLLGPALGLHKQPKYDLSPTNFLSD